MGVRSINPIDLFLLSRGEYFLLVKGPQTFQKTLAAKNFMNSGDAAGKIIGGIKKGRIAVRYFYC